uniref:BTB domain-containing protein n=1 Tax=Parastrongyloides trichosuri TaxID=131310 RepID=A0A0N4Z928_PARTI
MTSNIFNNGKLETSTYLTKSSIPYILLEGKNSIIDDTLFSDTDKNVLPHCENYLIESRSKLIPSSDKKIITISNGCENEAGGVVNQVMAGCTKYVTSHTDCVSFWTSGREENIKKTSFNDISMDDEDSGNESSIFDNNTINISMNTLLSIDNSISSRTISESSVDDIIILSEPLSTIVLCHNDKKYFVDKNILQKKSKKFLKIFENELVESSFKIPRPFLSEHVNEVINYLMVDFCNFSTKNIYGVLRLAYYYEMEELVMYGENWVVANLDYLNLPNVYNFFIEFDRKNLISSLLEYVKNHFEAIFGNDVFLEYDFNFFAKIFCEIILPDIDIQKAVLLFMDWIDYDYISRLVYFKWLVSIDEMRYLSRNFIMDMGTTYFHFMSFIEFNIQYVNLLTKVCGGLNK